MSQSRNFPVCNYLYLGFYEKIALVWCDLFKLKSYDFMWRHENQVAWLVAWSDHVHIVRCFTTSGIPFSTCSFVANYLRQNYSSFQGRKISWKWGFNWKPHNLEIKELFYNSVLSFYLKTNAATFIEYKIIGLWILIFVISTPEKLHKSYKLKIESL